MGTLNRIFVATMLCLNLLFVEAADCDASQPRNEGDPTGTDIASFLSNTVDSPISGICAGGIPPLNNNVATFSANLMTFNVTREDSTKELENCQNAFQNIIEQCVQNDKFLSLNGFHYSIKNHVFPDNGIQGPDPIITRASPTSTVLTETDSSGNTVTVTFVQSTVTEFSSLSTTTTITSTSTENDGMLIVIPLMLGVGGLVWIPIGGPLPPGVTPPPTPSGPEGEHPDQPNSNTDATTATSSTLSGSSTIAIPTVDAIAELSLPDYQKILKIQPEGPLPTEEDAPSSLEAPSTDSHVGTVECFPMHGTTEMDRVVSLAITDTILDLYFTGTKSDWQRVGGAGGISNADPISNNHYDATFTLGTNAPEPCKVLYTEEGKSHADVQNFCKIPFKAILEQCPFDGGKVASDCGDWTLQSRPLGGRCKVGEPGSHCKTVQGGVCV